MRAFFIHAVVIGCLLLAACAPALKGPPRITETDVRAMLAEVETVSKAENVEGIMGFMADDIEISITARGPMGTTKQTMDREAYERELKMGITLTENYDFRSQIRNIEIGPDGQSAVVELDIYEVVEMFGITVTSVTDETALIQRRDGRLMFVKISAQAEMSMEPKGSGQLPAPGEGI